MSGAAHARSAVVYLPIDGLVASLEDALAEIAEIRSRPIGFGGSLRALPEGVLSQYDRISICEGNIKRALELALDYAKGPAA